MRKRLFYQQSEPRSRQAQKTWRTSVLARIMMALFALMLIPQGTWAQIDYYSYNEASGAFEKASASSYSTLSGSSVDVSLTSGITYVCSESNVSYAGRIIVNGTVDIILCDGAKLNATKGIHVGSGSILNIYGQELGTGQLNANGYKDGSSKQFAAIGADYVVMNSRNANRAPATNTLGSVNIHGGQINADSRNTDDAAGIGGCYSSFGSVTVTIYGGKVTATGGTYGAGIGGGKSGVGGTVKILGGEVVATGGKGDNTYGKAMGIGAGSYSSTATGLSNGTLTLGSGVTCYNNSSSAKPVEINQDAQGDYARVRYMKTVKSYDLWVNSIQVTEGNRTNIWGPGTDFSFNPVNSTLYYKNGGSSSYSINSGLPNLTIKIGSPDATGDYTKNNIGVIQFGSPDGKPVSAPSGTLTISKEDGVTGVQQFDIVGSGSVTSVIRGFDNVTYSDFVILRDGVTYNTTNKQLEYPNPSGSGFKGLDETTTFVTADGLLPPTMSGDNLLSTTTLVLANQMSVGTLKYDVDHADGTRETNQTYDDNNRPRFYDAATITAYLNVNGVNSSSVIGKNFVYNDFAVVYSGADETLTVPDPNPTIAATDGVGFKYTVDPAYYESVQSDAAGQKLTLKGLGSSDVIVEFLPSATATMPYKILNPNNQTDLWVRSVPKAPTITYNKTKQYLDTDELEISGISGSSILYTWDDSPSVTMTTGKNISVDLTNTNLSLYNSTNKPKVQTGTVKAWAVVYEDGYYWIGGESTQAFSAKQDISNYYIADISGMDYTGSVVSPTITVKASSTTTTALVENTDYTVSYKQNGNVVSPIGVGTYDVVITGKGNYAGTIATKTFTISPFDITNAATLSTLANETYTGNPFAPKPTVTVSLGGSDKVLVENTDYTISYEQKGAAVSPTAAGTYDVKITGKVNFKGSASTTFTIAAAAGSMTSPTALTLTYTGADQSLVAAGSSTTGTVEYKLSTETTWGTAIPKKKDAGTYTVNYRLKGDSNHNDIASQDLNVTISPFDITNAASLSTLANETYTGNPFAPKPTVTVSLGGSDKVLVENTDYTISYEQKGAAVSPTAAGTYDVKITGKVNFKGSASTTFTIAAAAGSMTAPTALTLTYTGADQSLVAAGSSTTGTVEYKLSTETTWGTAIPKKKDAGTYTVNYRLKGDSNHNDIASQDLNVTISPFDITNAATFSTIADETYTGNPFAPKPTVTVSLGGSDKVLVENTDYTISYEQKGAAVSPTAAGTYDVKITGKVNFKGSASTTFTIAAAAGSMTAPTALTLTYTGADQALVAAGSSTTGTVEYKLSTETTWGTAIPKKKDAGTYTVNYRLKGDSNHNDIASQDLNVTISPFDITNAASLSTIADETYTGNPFAPKPTVTVSLGGSDKVLVENTDYTISYEQKGAAVSPTAAGTYDVKITGKVNFKGSASTTFTIAAAAGSMTSPTALTLTYTGADQSLVAAGSSTTGTVEYKLSTETTWGTAIPKKKDAGTYTVNYRLKGDSNHNDIASQDLNVTISPFDITNAASLSTLANETYTGNPFAPKPTVTVSLGGSDKVLVENTDYTISYEQKGAAVSPTAAGTYDVKITGKVNFKGSASTTFTIDQATITSVEIDQTQFVYDPTQERVVNVTKVMAGTLVVPVGSYEIVSNSNKATARGTHTVTVQGKAGSNFKGTASTTFTITERTVNIDFGGRTFRTFYDANEPFLVPDNMTAYIVTGVSGNAVTTKKVSYIQAGVPVLLEKTPGTTNVVDPAESYVGNKLKYAAAAITPNAKHYVLYSNEFVRATGTINGKVYLDLNDTGAGARSTYVINTDETTAVDGLFIEEDDSDAKWYDMQGRRINKPTRSGVYIKDGKKVVVKTRY